MNVDVDVDVEDDDLWGFYMWKIICEIFLDLIVGKESLKLILVYIGEMDFYFVVDEIYKDLIVNGVINI